jgi:hypothetical protein
LNAFVFRREDYVSESNFNFYNVRSFPSFFFLIIMALNFGGFLDCQGVDVRLVLLLDSSSAVLILYAREVVFVMNYLTGLFNCMWYEA